MVNQLIKNASYKDKIIGVRIPVEEDEEKPWDMKPSRKPPEVPKNQVLPESVNIVISNQIFIDKKNFSPVLINKLIRIAAFQNPEFYTAQRMRLSTFGKPRIISCAENFPEYIGLPRGCLDEVMNLLDSLNIKVLLDDKRYNGKCIKLKFLGKLTDEQKKVIKELSVHETGVLSATTAFGKTVIGAYMIAKRKTNTLIIFLTGG